ncbi:MAG TPA: arginine deiminase-related protein, partial [Sphingobacteriaceae bacterium]
ERRMDLLEKIKEKFQITRINDLSIFEKEEKFLEGTGSMVLDRESRIAYACLSPRTDLDVLSSFCLQSGFKPVYFHSLDKHGQEIYHTNVMMCVGTRFVVICLETIRDQKERELVVHSIISSGKVIVEISEEQMGQFAGNMLQVRNGSGDDLLVMSERAFQALTEDQIGRLEKYCRLVHSPLTVIENNGGGSARCMMAEIHLPEVAPG